MKEIIVVAGILAVLFSLLWLVVVSLERMVEKRGKGEKEERKRGKESKEDDETILVIASGIVAHERSFNMRRREKRVLYEEKEEKVSLWRVGGRARY